MGDSIVFADHHTEADWHPLENGASVADLNLLAEPDGLTHLLLFPDQSVAGYVVVSIPTAL